MYFISYAFIHKYVIVSSSQFKLMSEVICKYVLDIFSVIGCEIYAVYFSRLIYNKTMLYKAFC